MLTMLGWRTGMTGMERRSRREEGRRGEGEDRRRGGGEKGRRGGHLGTKAG